MTELAPGARLSHFVISRKLGAGGMGVVYEALDETLGRKVAVKVLTAELVGSAERRQRFLREARSAAAMSHPNIATVHEIDEASGQVFIVMELVPGENLRDVMAQGRMPISRALDIAQGISEAAAHAHAAGVVHRDLKPENVMVLSGDRVKVLDFGIAKPDDDLGTANTLPASGPITEEGRVIGTPGYMAPEQARGAPVDARTDVFAIGVVLYEMVTGTRPFAGSSSLDVMVATSRDDPPPISSHSPGAPPIVETIVRRCLAKAPEARYQTAGELARALASASREVAAHEMATTQAMPTPFPAKPPPAPSPTTTAAAIVPPPPAATRSSRVTALVGLVLACTVVGFVGSKVVRNKRARAAERAVAAGSAAAAPAITPKLGLDTLERYGNESASLSPGEWESAALDFERAHAQPGAPGRWAASRLLALGMRDLAHGKLDAAEQSLTAAAARDGSFALPHAALSSLLVRQGKPDDAVREAQTAQSLAPDLVLAIAAAGRAHAAAGKHTDAIEQFRRALEKSPAPTIRAQLALAYHHAGFDDAAVREAGEVLKSDPDNVMARVVVAERALEKGDAKQALEHTERAVAVEPRNGAAWLAHGDALLLAHRQVEAKKALTEAVRLWSDTRQVGAPVARLEQVKAALDAGRLPAPRHSAKTGRALPAPAAAPRSMPAKATQL
ncbi:MAG: protein kinase [Myxococcales bacterium]|nr:protein kinase [Myxococcales bacterium]